MATSGISFSTLAAMIAAGLSWSVLAGDAVANELPAGFVRLSDVAPTIRQDMRYAGFANFLSRPAKGYDDPACILTEATALALSTAQDRLAAENLTLIVFDCYRPVSAVADFVAWTRQGGAVDPRWHPRVKRKDLIATGYIGARSSHSRGSTVDVAIAPLAAGTATPRQDCGTADANTLDFGTGFDCFDPASQTARGALPADARKNRQKLLDTMNAAGFQNYAREWWHFTLTSETDRKTRYDFPVTGGK